MRFKFGAGATGDVVPKVQKPSGEKEFVLDGWGHEELGGPEEVV